MAKKIAKEKGIDLINIKGSGEAGRIVKRDVESFSLMNQTSVGSNLSNEFTVVGKENLSEIQNSQIRKTIAKRLSNSKFSAPHYYLTMEINMDNAVEFRNQYNSNPTVKISFNDINGGSFAITVAKKHSVHKEIKGKVKSILKNIQAKS